MSAHRTLDSLRSRYLREQSRTTKPTTQREEARLWRTTILPGLGPQRELGELVARSDGDHDGAIAAWFAELAGAPYTANRALNSLSHALALAERLRWIPAESNPCPGIRRYPEQPRLRYPDRSELQRLDAALARLLEGGAITEASHDAIQALALTGCRRSEVLRLAWRPGTPGSLGWVDLDEAVLRFHDSKGGPKEVPLNRRALELFRRRAHARGPSPWCFPGRAADVPLAGLQRAWERACELAGITGACIHSLRHSFATRALEAGVELRLLMGLLGHRDVRSALRYQHPTLSALRRATESLDAINA